MPAYFADGIEPRSQQPRSPMFWLVFGTLALAQLLALWLLCSHQVRKAEARSTEVQVRQMALSDCLQYVPGSTIASCTLQIDGVRAQALPAGNPAVAGATPVSFTR
ncbi:MAG TPA: hypothetical protein VLK85_17735 [Ramlibacter sp.]|nr:hypothetical protein [Ramlibacter sp.]